MRILPVLAVIVGLLCGCSAAYYERSADRQTLPIVKDYQGKVDKERPAETPEGVITPRPESAEPVSYQDVAPSGQPRLLSLKDSLALAFSNSRDFKFQKESLYLSALGFTSVLHNYEWNPSATLSGDISADANGDQPLAAAADARAALALTRRLISGGTFSINAAAMETGEVANVAGDSNSSSASARFSQPLLAGSGVAAREALVQARRDLLYDARDFELFREQLAIDVLSDYYQLLLQRSFVATAKANVDFLTFLYERSDALFNKGMLSLVDVFRAKQEKLQAENRLSDRQAAYNLALDRFKISLGLPTDENVDVADEPIEPEIIGVSLEQAVKTALDDRLDLMSARERLADYERKVLVARNALLPELNFFIQTGISSEPGHDLLDFSTASGGAASAGLTLVLPVDKKSERNAYKASLVALDRQRRSFALAEDNVKLNVRETVRNLHRAEVSLVIQKENVDLAQQRREAAQLLFEKGEYGNRDIIEAETALQDAKNAYASAKVDYLVANVQLRKDIGTLRVDEQGQWH